MRIALGFALALLSASGTGYAQYHDNGDDQHGRDRVFASNGQTSYGHERRDARHDRRDMRHDYSDSRRYYVSGNHARADARHDARDRRHRDYDYTYGH